MGAYSSLSCTNPDRVTPHPDSPNAAWQALGYRVERLTRSRRTIYNTICDVVLANVDVDEETAWLVAHGVIPA